MEGGHSEFWGVFTRTETITVLICNRCGRAYEPSGGPFVMTKGSDLTVIFPCCPDGGQHIEWAEQEVNA